MGRVQVLAEGDQTPTDVALDRAEWKAGAVGDLLVCQPLDIGHRDDAAWPLREIRQCTGDDHAICDAVELGLGRRWGVAIVLVSAPFAVAPFAADVIDDPSLGDADQPGAQGSARGVELLAAAP